MEKSARFGIIRTVKEVRRKPVFDVWKNVLAEVEQTIPREQFSTWFAGTELVSVENGLVVIGVSNIFKVKQLQTRYSEQVQTALKNNGVEVKSLRYEVTSAERQKGRRMAAGIAPREVSVARDEVRKVEPVATGLNPKYTLDNFVIGSNNDLAVNVARNIIENPGVSYNPFFLYGGPGLGKTHLVQAIGNELLRKNPKLKILYTPTSSFYSEFIKSLHGKKSNDFRDDFRQKFKRLDVLIIDDFQMIIKKEASQQEFFDIFNELYQLNKQIIVTSDRLPEQIESMDVRLSSRLSQAGAWDLQLPQFEDRCAILRSKAEFKGVKIEDEAIEYIAESVKTNIRALEGELEHVLAVADFKGMTPLEVINEGYASASGSARTKLVAPRQVVEKVAKHYQLSVKEMCGKSRVSHIKNARQVAMYLLSKELGMSTPKIASEVGVKDHTTVMHGIKKIESDLKLNFVLRDEVATIRGEIYD